MQSYLPIDNEPDKQIEYKQIQEPISPEEEKRCYGIRIKKETLVKCLRLDYLT